MATKEEKEAAKAKAQAEKAAAAAAAAAAEAAKAEQPVQPAVPAAMPTAAERLAEMVSSASGVVAESARVFLTPQEVLEAVELGDVLAVDEMSLAEVEAELEAIGDPFARRIALGAHRGALIAGRDKAMDAMNTLIGVCEDAIHKSRETEAVLQNRQAELNRAKERIAFEASEQERVAAANLEGSRRAREAERLMHADA